MLVLVLERPTARRVVLLAVLVGVELALGATAVLTGFPLAVVLAHNLAGALLLTTLVTVNCRVRAAPRGA